jgi:HK97 family phage prohead protease
MMLNSRLRSGPSLTADCLEYKSADIALRDVSRNGRFEGYASLFSREDLGRDVIVPGAFRETLARRGARGIRLLYQHDPAEPIGTWDRIHEDARGLFVRGRIMSEVTRGREVLALMHEGAIDGLSIGFHATKAHRDRRTGIRRIETIDLWEISVVTFPMQPEARIRTMTDREPHPDGRRQDEARLLIRMAGAARQLRGS